MVDTRCVMGELGLELPEDVEVRVHNSTADARYIVLPLRPAGTEHWRPADLEMLVGRDSMIGVMDAPPGSSSFLALPTIDPGGLKLPQ